MRTRSTIRVVRLLAAASFLAACALPPSQASPPRAGAADDQYDRWLRSRTAVISADEIAATGVDDLNVAVRRLRPEFLRVSPSSLGLEPQIAVFINEAFAGDATSLSTIPASVVERIVYIRPMEGLTRLGPQCRCRDGALLITVRRK